VPNTSLQEIGNDSASERLLSAVDQDSRTTMKPQRAITTTIVFQMSFLMLACSGQGLMVGSDQPNARKDTLLEYSSPQVTFLYTNMDRDSIAAIARYVEAHRARIVADLQPESLSTIRIYLYPTLKDLHQAIGWPDAPKWVKGAVSGIREVRMISPGSPDLEGSVPYDYMLGCIVHEFTHCVMLHANGTIANRPRWLWESIAIYESGQSADLKNLGYLTTSSPPTLDDLNNINDTRIYEVGHSIAEYIVSKWGLEAVRGLIRTNGDLASTLHISQGEFQEGWYAYVMNKYS
jgi:hypothetical protein